jgi:hypothetical protein
MVVFDNLLDMSPDDIVDYMMTTDISELNTLSEHEDVLISAAANLELAWRKGIHIFDDTVNQNILDRPGD